MDISGGIPSSLEPYVCVHTCARVQGGVLEDSLLIANSENVHIAKNKSQKDRILIEKSCPFWLRIWCKHPTERTRASMSHHLSLQPTLSMRMCASESCHSVTASLHSEVASGWGSAPGAGLQVTAEGSLACTRKDFRLLAGPVGVRAWRGLSEARGSDERVSVDPDPVGNAHCKEARVFGQE